MSRGKGRIIAKKLLNIYIPHLLHEGVLKIDLFNAG
jgi:hypothetical protein